jgi:hypothetical protein
MPEISRFFGIIIRMYMEAGAPHQRPHFHAYYQDQSAIIGIDEVELIQGGLPLRQLRLVIAWAEIHKLELAHDWDCLQNGEIPVPIKPLR